MELPRDMDRGDGGNTDRVNLGIMYLGWDSSVWLCMSLSCRLYRGKKWDNTLWTASVQDPDLVTWWLTLTCGNMNKILADLSIFAFCVDISEFLDNFHMKKIFLKEQTIQSVFIFSSLKVSWPPSSDKCPRLQVGKSRKTQVLQRKLTREWLRHWHSAHADSIPFPSYIFKKEQTTCVTSSSALPCNSGNWINCARGILSSSRHEGCCCASGIMRHGWIHRASVIYTQLGGRRT